MVRLILCTFLVFAFFGPVQAHESPQDVVHEFHQRFYSDDPIKVFELFTFEFQQRINFIELIDDYNQFLEKYGEEESFEFVSENDSKLIYHSKRTKDIIFTFKIIKVDEILMIDDFSMAVPEDNMVTVYY